MGFGFKVGYLTVRERRAGLGELERMRVIGMNERAGVGTSSTIAPDFGATVVVGVIMHSARHELHFSELHMVVPDEFWSFGAGSLTGSHDIGDVAVGQIDFASRLLICHCSLFVC